MKTFTLTIIIGLILCVTLSFAVPRAAVIRSSWGFENEFDNAIETLAWKMEKFENTGFAALAPRLKDFDIVIVSSTGNYNDTVDMTPYKEQWLDYLQNGGVLFIVDANYGSVLDSWVNTFGPEFVLTAGGCAPHTKEHNASSKVEFNKDASILYVPNDLREGFIAKNSIWSHIESWPQGWTSAITCADNKSLFVYKEVDKGLIGLVNYASFTSAQEFASKLFENVMFFAQSNASKLSMISSTFPKALPGRQKGSIVLKNDSGAAQSVLLRFGSETPGAIESGETSATKIPSGATATIPFEVNIAQRGKIVLNIKVETDSDKGLEIRHVMDVPDLVTFRAKSRHQYDASQVTFYSTLVPDADMAIQDCTLVLSVDGRKLSVITAPKNANTHNIKTNWMGLGMHKAELKLMHKGKTLETLNEEFVLNLEPLVHSRDDGTLLIDGKPEFPFGWYTVSWAISQQEKLDFLKSIGEAGFNAAHMSCTDPEAWKDVLDEAAKWGVRVITEYSGDYPELIRMYKDHPAVLAWNPGDEPDAAGISPAEMLRRANSFRDVDPNHPAYMVLCIPAAYAKYAASADIIAPDVYPIPHAPISNVYNHLLAARTEAARHDRPIWSVVQAFGYNDKPNSWRVPTPEECRNMTYQSFLAGAKGIIFYTYYDGYFDIRKKPEFWEGIKKMVPEVNIIKPFLMSGMPEVVETGQENVFAATWKHEGRRLLIVVNANSVVDIDVSIDLPEGSGAGYQSIFENNPQGLYFTENKLNGTIKALEIGVYRN